MRGKVDENISEMKAIPKMKSDKFHFIESRNATHNSIYKIIQYYNIGRPSIKDEEIRSVLESVPDQQQP